MQYFDPELLKRHSAFRHTYRKDFWLIVEGVRARIWLNRNIAFYKASVHTTYAQIQSDPDISDKTKKAWIELIQAVAEAHENGTLPKEAI